MNDCVQETRDNEENKYDITKGDAIAGLKITMKYFAERESFDMADKVKNMVNMIENGIVNPKEELKNLFEDLLKSAPPFTNDK